MKIFHVDEPREIGKKKERVSSKDIMMIKKDLTERIVKKKDALPFKVPKNISLVVVDVESGLQPSTNTKKIIYESFKRKDNIIVGLENLFDEDRLGFYDSENRKKILKFY